MFTLDPFIPDVALGGTEPTTQVSLEMELVFGENLQLKKAKIESIEQPAFLFEMSY